MKKKIFEEHEIDLCDWCGRNFYGQLTEYVPYQYGSLMNRLENARKAIFFGEIRQPTYILHAQCMEDALNFALKSKRPKQEDKA